MPPCIEVRRIRLADGKPIVIEHSQFPAALFPDLLDCRLDGSLYELLEDNYGQRPHRAAESLEPVVAGVREAEALEVERGRAADAGRADRVLRHRAAARVRARPVPRRPDEGRRLDLRSRWRPVAAPRGGRLVTGPPRLGGNVRSHDDQTGSYVHPASRPAAFDEHYLGVHMPLVAKMPGLERTETGKITAALDGGEQTYHRITALYFADQDAHGRGLRLAEGAATAADYGADRTARIATCSSTAVRRRLQAPARGLTASLHCQPDRAGRAVGMTSRLTGSRPADLPLAVADVDREPGLADPQAADAQRQVAVGHLGRAPQLAGCRRRA